MTQRDQIRDYIDRFGSITPAQAFVDLGITKLSTRISEMIADGEEFHKELVPFVTRLGKKSHYMKYSKENEYVQDIRQ